MQNLLLLLTADPHKVYKSRISKNTHRICAEGEEYMEETLKLSKDSETWPSAQLPPQTFKTKSNDLDSMVEGIKQLCEGADIEPEKLSKYMLPSAAGAHSTTPVNIEFEYGATFQLVVAYQDEKRIKDDAFHHVDGKENSSREDAKAFATRFKATVTEEQQKQFANSKKQPQTIQSSDDIQIHPEVKEIAGKVLFFAGDGRDPDVRDSPLFRGGSFGHVWADPPHN